MKKKLFIVLVALVGISASIGVLLYIGDAFQKHNPLKKTVDETIQPIATLAVSVREAVGEIEQIAATATPTPTPNASPKQTTEFINAIPVETGEEQFYLTGYIQKVVDGDTFIIREGEEDIRVRLIGVDTPESVAPPEYAKENTEEGQFVSDIVKEHFKGKNVRCMNDVSTIDVYGRELVYIFMEDGTMLQDWLLVNGLAQVMTIPPNVRYADHFVALEQQAKERGAGIWGWGVEP